MDWIPSLARFGPSVAFAAAFQAVLCSSDVSAAEKPAQPAPPLEAAQFDFWVGEWEVMTPEGRVAGTNRIEKILRGRVLQENWEGTGGYVGKSFNIYDATVGQWRQYWVDGSGLSLALAGGLVDGRMVLAGDRLQDGKPVRDRITWTPRADGTVRQLWELSEDAGKTWKVIFDGLYRRKGFGEGSAAPAGDAFSRESTVLP